MNQNIIDFFAYLQPIINSCSGFIKTDGYMTHFPGTVITMDTDETYCAIIKIPVIYDICITAKINTFLSLKEPIDQTLENLYFIGWNIKNQHLMNYYSMLDNIDSKVRCIYNEQDCYNINNFENVSAKTSIDHINISDGIFNYRIPASKAITSINKSDTASLAIYDWVYQPDNQSIKTVKYSVYKKKFKLTVDIFSNIIVV